MSKELIAYQVEAHLKSGGTLSVLLSLSTVNKVVEEHKKTGCFFATDVTSGEVVSVHKSALEFVNFKPMYTREEPDAPIENPSATESSEQGKSRESEGPQTTEAGRGYDSEEISGTYTKGCEVNNNGNDRG